MVLSDINPHPSIEVLPPCRDLSIGAKAVVSEIEQSLRSQFIPTQYAKNYFDELDRYRSLRQGVRVIGRRLTGKSAASRHYAQMADKRAALVSAPSDCSSRRLHGRILMAVGHAAPRGKRKDLRPRVAGCLRPFGYEMVIVDNAENLQKEALIDLKNLMDEQGITIVLCGTPDLDQLLEDYGLLDWFPHLYSFGSLNAPDLLATLNTIEKQYLRLPEASRLSDGQNFQVLTVKTHSYIGKLIQVIQAATLRSLEKGYQKIDSEILAKVADKCGAKYVPETLTYVSASPSGVSGQPQPALPSQAESQEQPSK
jgi:DNA transposition AAA+ family ATPase